MRDRTLCILQRGEPPNEVLLGFKKNGFGAGKYAGIGGKVEVGETVVNAAIRELEEEIGVTATYQNLNYVGRLTFLFPSSPTWSQVVHVFRVVTWEGNPIEGFEMKPVWFGVNQIPFVKMWQDAFYWLPRILEGEHIRMSFVFEDDNESIREIQEEAFLTADLEQG